jgi:hypothetical protein
MRQELTRDGKDVKSYLVKRFLVQLSKQDFTKGFRPKNLKHPQCSYIHVIYAFFCNRQY